MTTQQLKALEAKGFEVKEFNSSILPGDYQIKKNGRTAVRTKEELDQIIEGKDTWLGA